MDSKGFTREDYLLLAKMAQQTERHQEMLEYIQKFLRFDAELTPEERSIVSATYKNVVGNKRAELRVLTAIKQREDRKNNEVHINYIKNYERQIEGELRQLCNEILVTLEKNLIPNSKAMDSKVFYFKMIGIHNNKQSNLPQPYFSLSFFNFKATITDILQSSFLIRNTMMLLPRPRPRTGRQTLYREAICRLLTPSDWDFS